MTCWIQDLLTTWEIETVVKLCGRSPLVSQTFRWALQLLGHWISIALLDHMIFRMHPAKYLCDFVESTSGASRSHHPDIQVSHLRFFTFYIFIHIPSTHITDLDDGKKLQESPIFDGKNHGFRSRCSLKPIRLLISTLRWF